jgi:cellobiose-specific phosphotransferase system component IIC
VWGFISILLAMAIYYPFAKSAERQRLSTEVNETKPVTLSR